MGGGVTIIVPTYNRCTSLYGVIASIREQTYKNIKIYITDDCSEDHTTQVVNDIMNRYPDAPILYHRNVKNLKEYMNVNQAFVNCYGAKYVAVLQDDARYIDVNFIEQAVALMERDADITTVAGNYKDQSRQYKQWKDNVIRDGKRFWYEWPGIYCFWPACLFRYNTLAEIGFLDTSIISRADSLMVLKAVLKGKIGLLSSIVLEDGYHKGQSYYDSFYKQVRDYNHNNMKYYRNAADFAVMQGIDEALAQQWYETRFAGSILDILSGIHREGNDVDKNVDLLVDEIERYDRKVLKLVLKRYIRWIYGSQ